VVKMEKTSIYFAEPGSKNTDDVVKAVARRVEEGDVKTVVVASTSGNTGARFAEALKGKVDVVAVSHERMKPKFKDAIVGFGGVAVDGTHLPLHSGGMDVVRNTLYTLGQGFKVAVEVILIATDKGVIKPYKHVIGVAGTEEGADTAIVARSTTTKEVFSKEFEKRLEIREIIAMPIKKSWWE